MFPPNSFRWEEGCTLLLGGLRGDFFHVNRRAGREVVTASRMHEKGQQQPRDSFLTKNIVFVAICLSKNEKKIGW